MYPDSKNGIVIQLDKTKKDEIVIIFLYIYFSHPVSVFNVRIIIIRSKNFDKHFLYKLK